MIECLVLDDDPSQTDSLVILLRREGFRAEGAYDPEEALAFLRRRPVDLLLTDLRLGEKDGIWMTKQVKANFPDTQVLIITAYGTIESAVEAVKNGAFDYILKPIQPAQFRLTLERAVEWQNLRSKVKALENRLQESQKPERLLGSSSAIQRIKQMVGRIAASDAAVLIYGESGTGKELVAQMIHQKSRRADQPLVIVNCGALPETLQESELFGHVKGAFTGAHKDKKGLLAEADAGTLFLDEVGELSSAAQVKLLRFLENGECRRVGDTHLEKLDVRIVAATNRDLASPTQNDFRRDLFYRLNVIPITMPPLRDLRDDIPMMVRIFIEEFSQKLGVAPPRLSEDCLRLLLDHPWPGNVRELRNLMERAVVVDQDGLITMSDMPEHLQTSGSAIIETGLKKQLPLDEIEKLYILSTLQECAGSRKKTCQILGITKATLWRKLRTYADSPATKELSLPYDEVDAICNCAEAAEV